MTICHLILLIDYVLRSNYDYHSEDIIDIQNTSPILIVCGYWTDVNYAGAFFTHPVRNYWDNGLNASAALGSPQ